MKRWTRRKTLEHKRYLRRRLLAGKRVSDADIFRFFPVGEWPAMIDLAHPIRIVRYDTASEVEREDLRRALERLGSNAYGVSLIAALDTAQKRP